MTKREQIEQLNEAGVPDELIAERVGCHEAYVRTVRQRYGLPRNPILDAPDLRDALRRIEGAKTLAEVRRIAREALMGRRV